MKIMQIVMIFLSLFVMLGALAMPIWWSAAQPIIFNIPAYLEGVVRDMTGLLDLVLKSI